jgi:L-threonylcarbamoyladenylate synthase
MKNNLSNIKKAKNILDHQDCVAVPTETVYGLAANAYSDKAVKKIFKLKKRPQNNPLIVHYHNIDDLKRDCEINSDFLKLYKKFSPGPITYVLNLKKLQKYQSLQPTIKVHLLLDFPNTI